MKKHRILTAILLSMCMGALPIQVLLCPMPVAAYQFLGYPEKITYNDMIFAVLQNGRSNQLILLDYSGNEENLTIPETVDGKTVTAIQRYTFSETAKNTVKNVTLPDTINYFEGGIFEDFTALESINIPKSLRVIPSATFMNCTNLKSVDFHDDIWAVSENAFENTSVTVPPELKSDRNYKDSYLYTEKVGYFEVQIYPDENDNYYVNLLKAQFPQEESLNIIIPETIKGFPVKSFNYVYHYDNSFSMSDNFSDSSLHRCDIESIEFPKYMEKINTQAFKNLDGLKRITFNCSTEIEKSAFQSCKNLSKVIFGEETETVKIGKDVFKDCISLENLIIPENCRKIEIGKSAFQNTQMKKIEMDCDCTIGIDSFADCPIESATFNSNVTTSLDSFSECETLREVTFNGNADLSHNSFCECNALENINIDTSGKVFGNAFNGCENLVSINGEQAFDEKSGDFIPEYRDFIMQNFNGADNVGFINQYVQAQVKKIVSENITPDMNDMQKVRILHDWVCANTSYSPAGQESHNDAAILMNDTTVCEGYSRLCNLLYHEAGLETYYVTGVNHAWNIVKIDNHYFHVDSTWDDSNDEINYKWFCKSDSEMKNAGGNHASWKTAVISSLHDFQENISPECNYQMGDMNTDNEINIADMVKLEKYILNAEKPDDNLVLSDLNFDGITDVFDVIEMRKIIIEK